MTNPHGGQPKQRVHWPRILAEGVAIVVSILLAFGVQAWWEGVQDRAAEADLLTDLVEEFQANRAELERVNAQHRESAELTEALMREAGPNRLGLRPDSLKALADLTFFNPAFDPDRGVIARAQSGNGLSLISDPQLRARVAGFWDRFEYYFVNQDMPAQMWMQSLWNTGSLVHPSIPVWESMGPSVMWSDPLTPEEVNAVKYFSMRKQTDEVLVSQGEDLLAALDSLLADLVAAQRR